MKIKSLSQKGITPILLPLIIVAVLVAGILVYQTTKNPPSTSKSPAQPSQSKLKLVKEGLILEAKTTKTLDPKTGKAGDVVSTFSTKDPVIYLTLDLKSPKKGTKFEYVRYLKGKYVDHGSMQLTKEGVDNSSFSWELKNANVKRLAGNYKIKLYTNGNFEKEVSYQVR